MPPQQESGRAAATKAVGAASWRAHLASRAAIDLRALAALRVSCGLLLVTDLVLRSRDAAAFYTDAGVLPRHVLQEHAEWSHRLSLHAFSGEPWFQGLLFAVAAVAATCLAVGYRTRLATAASLALHVSLLGRNPLILNTGDSLLMLLLFWGLFLPLGAVWSVDAWFRTRIRPDAAGRGDRGPDGAAPSAGSPRPGMVSDVASAALLVQVVLVYSVNAVFKLRGDVWLSGEAVGLAFRLDRYALPMGQALADVPGLPLVLTWAWLLLVAGSFLLLVLHGRPRGRLAALYLAAHLGMLLTLRIGVFSLVSMAALLPFLPRSFWDAVESRWSRRLRAWLRDALQAFREALLPAPGGRRPVPARHPEPGGGAHPSPQAPWVVPPRRLRDAAAAACLGILLLWAAMALGYIQAPGAVEGFVGQHGRGWAMFDHVSPVQVSFVAAAVLESSEEVEALRPTGLDWEDPGPVGRFPDVRWRAYLSKLGGPGSGALVEAFGAYLCREAATHHGDVVERVHLYRFEEDVHPDGSAGEPRRVEVLGRECGVGEDVDMPDTASHPGGSPGGASSAPTPVRST